MNLSTNQKNNVIYQGLLFVFEIHVELKSVFGFLE